MKAIQIKTVWLSTVTCFAALTLTAPACGSDAETSASATRGRWGRPGTATGSARYSGDVGLARTQSRTGAINASRAVALGVDRNGLSLSVSTAVAPQRGPAIATNFSMSIGADGNVSSGFGTALSRGHRPATVAVSGGTSTAGRAFSTASVTHRRVPRHPTPDRTVRVVRTHRRVPGRPTMIREYGRFR